jgi:DNA-binding NtrC family response regulator
VGTTFKIYFPAQPHDTLVEESAPSGEMPAFGTETILLVEDDQRIRQLGAELLGFGGYTVLTAADGAEALEIYRERVDEIALVILDLIMPRMSGTQCLEALLDMDPDVKVLVASGYAPNGPMRALVEAGAKGAIDKPFDMKEMLQTVRRIIDGD